MTELDRCIAEQRACAATIASGENVAGAWMGLCDWIFEEVLIRLSMEPVVRRAL